MRRDQLEFAIRTACRIIGRPEVMVGSQSILGTFHEDELPARATRSMEIDILPIAESHHEAARLADLIDGVAGQFSLFEERNGFSIDGVDMETSALLEGWRDRLVEVRDAETAAPSGEPGFTGWCLDKEDLCAAKLCAYREKDHSYVTALLQAGLVDPRVIAERVAMSPPAARRAISLLVPEQTELAPVITEPFSSSVTSPTPVARGRRRASPRTSEAPGRRADRPRSLSTRGFTCCSTVPHCRCHVRPSSTPLASSAGIAE
ncbi:DUF6036 family nucleotidyltransferase [Nocardia farcinica]|uniref:DUF6036 family nucleotidyltransferase n=1 Tax=Nocardia farcinica TaxID=37329 RepID=UPI00245897AE|nr:DUF6036 family nucleotidyltransferase [Nocardia farcinica]